MALFKITSLERVEATIPPHKASEASQELKQISYEYGYVQIQYIFSLLPIDLVSFMNDGEKRFIFNPSSNNSCFSKHCNYFENILVLKKNNSLYVNYNFSCFNLS